MKVLYELTLCEPQEPLIYVLWCFMTQSAFLVSFDAVFYTSKKDIKEIWSFFFQDMAFQNRGKVILKLYSISYFLELLKNTVLNWRTRGSLRVLNDSKLIIPFRTYGTDTKWTTKHRFSKLKLSVVVNLKHFCFVFWCLYHLLYDQETIGVS